MGCTRRHFLLSICFLQLLAIIERQVFDFLGFMWAPILANFFHIIFVIFGVFGAYQLTAKYIVTYSVWNVLWIGWNTFLICFYLNIGILDRNSDILNLGTGSVSWFEVNGYGCKPTYPINITSEDPYRPVRPEKVDLCLLEYQNIEIIHSAVQCFLAILGLIGAICIGRIFVEEDDDRFDFMGGDAKSPQHTSVHPMYVSYSSIPASASATMTSLNKKFTINNGFTNQSNTNTYNSQNTINTNNKRNSNTSYGNRSDIRYTVVSTEHLVDDNNQQNYIDNNHHHHNDNNDNKTENYLMSSFGSQLNRLHINDGYLPQKRPNQIIKTITPPSTTTRTTTTIINNSSIDSRKMNKLNDLDSVVDSRDNIPIIENFSHTNSRNELNIIRPTNQYLNQIEQLNYDNNYKMPIQYVTRSPNLNRVSSRRRNERPQIINFCDQIRDQPPGYNNDLLMMQRAKSQDRLSYRQRKQNQNRTINDNNNCNNNQRPRSYCSNNGSYPEEE